MLRRFLFLVLISGIFAPCTGQNADINILRNFNGPFNPRPDAMMRGVSNSVMPLMIGVPIGILIADRISTGSWTEKKEGYVIGASVVATGIISFGLKYSVNRPRPFVTYSDIYQKDSHIGPYSFPSGHTSFAFALATSLSLCYPKWYVIAPAAMWACTVGYSRMYLGVHYPTDVLMGAVVGSGFAVISYYFVRFVHRKYYRQQPTSKFDWDPGTNISLTTR